MWLDNRESQVDCSQTPNAGNGCGPSVTINHMVRMVALEKTHRQ
ncbi:hypothetical protein RBSH_05208 [Rhodopirellula baltica SH28]|uniref:Uncharacterized protein n=1 Tax=Rhodopirellula baltica SH28 TaxID=993517 RepID=K5DAG5_RHOBT|nr:hypothetical protein RBSH_05208 [Rhodopirellula baltica SH28]